MGERGSKTICRDRFSPIIKSRKYETNAYTLLTYDNASVSACSGWLLRFQDPAFGVHLFQDCPQRVELEQPSLKLLHQCQQSASSTLGNTLMRGREGGNGHHSQGNSSEV